MIKLYFFQDIAGGTGSAVVNEDLLRVGTGNRTIIGITTGVSNLDVTFGTGTGFSNGANVAASVPQQLVLDTVLPRTAVVTDGSQRIRLLGGATLADGITVSYATITGVSP